MAKTIKELQALKREATANMREALAKGDNEAFEKAEREAKMTGEELRDLILEEQARAVKPATLPVSKNAQFRSVVKAARNGGDKEFVVQREVTSAPLNDGDYNNMEAAGLPVTVNDLINPLELDTIYDKVGLPIQTGVKGTLLWPCLDTVAEVSVAGEAVALEDTDLEFSKITAIQQRVGISIPVTNEAVNDAAFDLVGTVTTQINKALGRVLNKAAIGGDAVGLLAGPFASSDIESVSFAGDTPTYKELLNMKGVVAGKGVNLVGFCYIMNTVTYAALEATPITEGDSRMIIEGGKIAGYPVFVTDSAKIADGCVNAGCFGYAALNQHGNVYFIVDPYTRANKNETVFTLNADWSLTVLKSEAFIKGVTA